MSRRPPPPSRKRGQAADEGVEEPKRRRTSRGRASLAERDLSGEDAEKETKKHSADRIFWEKFSTPLLYAWLSDYKENPIKRGSAGANDRALIVDSLVQMGAERPKGKAVDAMMAIWKRQNPRAKELPPGLAGGDPENEEEEAEGDEGMLPEEEEQPLPVAETPVKTKRKLASDFMDSPHAASVTTATKVVPVKSPSQASAAASGVPSECITCLVPNHTPGKPWVCTGCGNRGDLRSDHPTNLQLAQRALVVLQATHAPASSSSSSVGQSSHHTHDTHSRLTLDPLIPRRDKEFIRATERGGIFNLFSGPSAGATIPVADAIDETRKALGASSMERPSEQLIELIRAGKLNHVGYAVPRSLAAALGAEDEQGSIVISSTGVSQAKGSNAPASVSSLQVFTGALVSTILPALADRPAALLQWLTLARTALELERRHGWTAADAYVTQLLNERIPQKKGFAEVSDQCIQSVQFLRPSPSHSHSGGLPPTNGAPKGFCTNFNIGIPCAFNPCPFKHECNVPGCINRAAHAAPSCPRYDADKARKKREQIQNDRDRRNKKPPSTAKKPVADAPSA